MLAVTSAVMMHEGVTEAGEWTQHDPPQMDF